MIEFFDTTTLVAAMVEDEAHHEACAEALENADAGYASVHSLAECYVRAQAHPARNLPADHWRCPTDVHLMTSRLTGRTLAGGLVDGPVYERIFSTTTGAGGEPSSVGTRTGMHHFE